MHFAGDDVANSEVSGEYENPMADGASLAKKKKKRVDKMKEKEFDDASGDEAESVQGITNSTDAKKRAAIRKSAEKQYKRAVKQAKKDGTEPPQPLEFNAEGDLIDTQAEAAAAAAAAAAEAEVAAAEAALAETERLRALFDEMDADKAGSLSPGEVKVLLENIGFKLSKKKLAKAFEVMDADGSGQIDFEEFIAWHDSLTEEEREELRLMADQARQASVDEADRKEQAKVATAAEKKRMRAVFNKMDDDGSGELDRGEIRTLLTKLGLKLNKKKQDKAFKAMDADGSGEISFDEFFEWYDSLSQDEREELRAMGDETFGKEDVAEATADESEDSSANPLPPEIADHGDEDHMRALFAEIDADGSMTLDTEEINLLFSKLGMKLNRAQQKAAFKTMDADGSGEISWEEFLAWRKALDQDELDSLRAMAEKAKRRALRRADADDGDVEEAELEEKVRALFDRIDDDGSGSLDTSEVKTLFSKIGLNLSTKKMKEAFAVMDEDGSGDISWKEFQLWFRGLEQEDRDNLLFEVDADSMGLAERVRGGWLADTNWFIDSSAAGYIAAAEFSEKRHYDHDERSDLNFDHLEDDLTHVMEQRLRASVDEKPLMHVHGTGWHCKSVNDAYRCKQSQEFSLHVDAILRNYRSNSSSWIMKTITEDLETDLDRAIEANMNNPAYGFCDDDAAPTNEGTFGLAARVRGGTDHADVMGESLVTPHVPKRKCGIIDIVTRQVDTYLSSRGLVRAGVPDTPYVSPLEHTRTKLRRKPKLQLSQRVRGGDASDVVVAPDTEGGEEAEEGENDDEGEEQEVEEIELSPEDKEIMETTVGPSDPALLKEQADNSHLVKLYTRLADDLLEKVDVKINPNTMKCADAVIIFCGCICDLAYCQVALALCPVITDAIAKIKYTPEGEDVALVLPNIMKNMLQKGVDDMVEGTVKEQVEKLVKNAMKMAGKQFKKLLPGVPSLDDDNDDTGGSCRGDTAAGNDGAAEIDAEAEGGGVLDVNTQTSTSGEPETLPVEGEEEDDGSADISTDMQGASHESPQITLEEGINAYDEDGASVGPGTAALAMIAGGGVALALGMNDKSEDGASNPVLKVLDESTMNMLLYNLKAVEPLLKIYSKRAHTVQREWFAKTGKAEMKAFQKAEKKKKAQAHEKYKVPLHTFHAAGLTDALQAMVRKMNKSGGELKKLGRTIGAQLPSADTMGPHELRTQAIALVTQYVLKQTEVTCRTTIDKRVGAVAGRGMKKREAATARTELRTNVDMAVEAMVTREVKQIMEKSYWKTNHSIELPDTEPSVSLHSPGLPTAKIEGKEHDVEKGVAEISEEYSNPLAA
eukprot:COSAG02_NODE_4402_length_5402_cov_2.660947_1_plen_1328_part_10